MKLLLLILVLIIILSVSGCSTNEVKEQEETKIEKDIFYIMTHQKYNNFIKARFERINEDALKIKEKFYKPEEEITEKVYEYSSESITFSVSYPDYLLELLPIPNTTQVFLATEEFCKDLQVNVSEFEICAVPLPGNSVR